MSFNITKNINKFFPKMGLFLRSFQDAKDKTMPSMNTKWGFSLAGNVEMANGVFEPEETRVVLSLLDEVEFFINVGANIGYYTCHALAKGKRAIAVEPMQRNVYYLLKNIKSNGWEKQVEVFPVAVGRINTSSRIDKDSMRVLSPSILPPLMLELGSMAITASRCPWFNSSCPIASMKVLFPTPGTPVIPMRQEFPL
mgnify:CR=1 FL=1